MMKIEQRVWTAKGGWQKQPSSKDSIGFKADLVFAFGARSAVSDKKLRQDVSLSYPSSRIFWCTTAGEIVGTQVNEGSLVVTAVKLEKTKVKSSTITISSVDDSFSAGQRIAKSLVAPGLAHVLVISDGLKVNGSKLVAGMVDVLPDGIAVTGGLAGDGVDFKETLVGLDCDPKEGSISAVGLYGKDIKIGYGSLGGWESFGPERKITRSKGNVLYELDGKSALKLYKEYLGSAAKGLPATGLLFPLSLRTPDSKTPIVRTILSVEEKAQSMTFAGEMPEGTFARLMKSNTDLLIEGAISAAKASMAGSKKGPELALLISCVGRKLVMKQRVEEEVEAVSKILGDGAVLTGFYSYGEICPFKKAGMSHLHNQTMTITTFSER